MIKTVLKIDGMMCGMCESHMNDVVRKSCSPKKVNSSAKNGETVVISEAPLDIPYLKQQIKDIGYELVSYTSEPYEKKEGCYAVELDRTAFFPEGGGQYADTGKLKAAKVSDVREKNGRILHITDQPFEAGEIVEGEIDWETRFMKMQQHTGEHIVSGIVHARYGFNNVGFHLGTEDCTMDFDGEISKEALQEIELEANRAVWKNLTIEVSYPSKEELEELDYRSKIEIEGQVRIVSVPGYDICACCAPHVERTGEIGMIKLVNMQRYKGGVRVTMLCGSRALTDYEKKQEQNRKISALLCAKEYDTAEAVGHLKEELDSLKRTLVEKERQLVHVWAQSVPEEEKTVCMFSEDISADAMRQYVNEVLGKERILCAVFYGNDAAGYRYVIGSRTQDLRAFSKMLNAAFEGRGLSVTFGDSSPKGRANGLYSAPAKYTKNGAYLH